MSTNKANLPRSVQHGIAETTHYSNIPVGCRLRKTNPISATVPTGRSAFPGCWRAKQTQFGLRREQQQVLYVKMVMTNLTRASVQENKANPCYDADREIGVLGGQLCKTKPISGRWPTDGISSISLFYHSTIPVRCRLCETNPIWPGPDGAGSRQVRDAKRSQFGRSLKCEVSGVKSGKPGAAPCHHPTAQAVGWRY